MAVWLVKIKNIFLSHTSLPGFIFYSCPSHRTFFFHKNIFLWYKPECVCSGVIFVTTFFYLAFVFMVQMKLKSAAEMQPWLLVGLWNLRLHVNQQFVHIQPEKCYFTLRPWQLVRYLYHWGWRCRGPTWWWWWCLHITRHQKIPVPFDSGGTGWSYGVEQQSKPFHFTQL